MQIDIVMLTMGREKYLKTALQSLIREANIAKNIDIQLILISQGYAISQEITELLLNNKEILKIKVVPLKENIGTTKGLIESKKYIRPISDLVMKMDEDCEIITNNFFIHLDNIYRFLSTEKNTEQFVLSPFPVGLINNLGGPPKTGGHYIIDWSDKFCNTIYTLRRVSHVGGFARISTKKTFMNVPFENDNTTNHSGHEDGIFSKYCLDNNILMFYLENAMAVEHQESTLGQQRRYKEYFK